MYAHFRAELGSFSLSQHLSDYRLFGMYHSNTPQHNKDVILKSLSERDGVVRIGVCQSQNVLVTIDTEADVADTEVCANDGPVCCFFFGCLNVRSLDEWAHKKKKRMISNPTIVWTMRD